MGYYLANNNVQSGPFELHDLPNHGLRADSLVWREGMPDWQRADAVPQVAAMLQPAPVTPVQQGPIVRPAPSQPQQTIHYHSAAPTDANGMAVASLVLGIVSVPGVFFYCFGLITAILAIVFGFIGRSRVRNGQSTTGDGLALAGIILGFGTVTLALLLLVVMLIFIASVGARP